MSHTAFGPADGIATLGSAGEVSREIDSHRTTNIQIENRVEVGTASNEIVTGPAADSLVVATPPKEKICAVISKEGIVRSSPMYRVGPGTAVKDVRLSAPYQAISQTVSVYFVLTVVATDQVLTVASGDLIVTLQADDDVSGRRSLDRVGRRRSDNGGRSAATFGHDRLRV